MKPLPLAILVVAIFATGFFAGRLSMDGASASPTPTVAVLPQAAPVGMPAGMPGSGAPEQPQVTVIQGTVAEVIQVPNYTYVRLNGPSGEAWAAVSTTSAVVVGQSVSIAASTQMVDFTSKSLNRTFASIWFGELGGAGTAPRPAAALAPGATLPPGHPPTGGAGNPAADAVAAVKRAEGAVSLRVADVHTERQLLAGRLVRVKGSVSRVNSVNGKTYAHLSDGSGTKEAKDNDLTVILSAEVKQDEQITAEGTVALDRDLGMGTTYPVVLDAAQVVGK